jgi:hypothetical protein
MSKSTTIVFIASLIVAIFSSVSIIFPGVIISFTVPQSELNPFELGEAAYPFVLSMITLLIITILYKKKQLPSKINIILNSISEFEISKNKTILIIIILIAIYSGFTIPELSIDESEQIPDYWVFEQAKEIWPFGQHNLVYVEEQNDRFVKMIFLIFSLEILQNVKILPFIFSIFVILITYFLTRELSRKRFAGVISMIVVLQSYTFLRYDTIAIYDNFWTFFYILSLYLIFKKPYFSWASYILSIFSKAFSFVFLPMSIFIILKHDLSIKKKLLTCMTYVGMIAAVIIIWQMDQSLYTKILELNVTNLLIGFTKWSYQMRYDYLLIFSLIPLLVALYYKAKEKIVEAEIVIFLIFGMLISGPIIESLTSFYGIFPYRFVPLIIFFALGVGMLFRKKTNLIQS